MTDSDIEPKPDRARIIAPPPVFGLICIGLAFPARHFEPLRLFPRKNAFILAIGALLILLAAVVIAMARKIFIAHGTHPNPYTPTKAIVVTGIYEWSRNPIYVAFLLFVLAFAFLANSLWFIVFDAVLFLLLYFGVVKREEAYLLDKFGEPYAEYCRRVRRWL